MSKSMSAEKVRELLEMLAAREQQAAAIIPKRWRLERPEQAAVRQSRKEAQS